MRSASEYDDPVIFIETLPSYWTTGSISREHVPIGKANVAVEGRDVTIVTHSLMVRYALAAAAALAKHGIFTEVVDLRLVAPGDSETVFASVSKTGPAVVVKESEKEFAIGSEI